MMAVEHNIRLSAVDFKRGYIRALLTRQLNI